MAGISKRIRGSWVSSDYGVMKTATDTITTLPAVLYPNDTTATVGLKGNMSQTGTPTPDNPVMPNGTGERTGNLLDADIYYGTYKQADGTYQSTRANLYNVQIKPFTADDIGKTFTFVADISPITGNARLCANINGTIVSGSNTEKSVVTFTVETADDLIFFNYGSNSTTVTTLSDIMLVEGSTAPTSYIPYGYKLTISSANTTTPVYLGEIESTRRIKKLILTGEETYRKQGSSSTASLYAFTVPEDTVSRDNVICSHLPFSYNYPTVISICFYSDLRNLFLNFGLDVMNAQPSGNTVAGLKEYLAAQYAAGTPVTVWYVLATPETAVVNEPLMKIGDYADEVSNVSIPVTAGGDTISVDTTLQPSEVTINYKGWHPVQSVHERENGAWT